MLTLTAIALTLTATAAQAKRTPITVRISDKIVATWVCQDKIPTERTHARSPWKKHGKSFRVAELNRWTLRHQACLEVLHERARQYNWQAWLPDKWRRVGMCETQLNWQHSNSGYQGAFGFAIQSWDQFKLPGYPDEAWQASPWQQYQVALAIWRRFGFSGWGCRAA